MGASLLALAKSMSELFIMNDITINRAYVYKKYLNTRSIMTWLYSKSSSADIISKKKSILIWCYGTEDNFYL